MKKYYFLAIFSVAVLAFSSCKKDSTPTTLSFMRLINMSPNSGTLDLYLNAQSAITGTAYGTASSFASVNTSSSLLSVTQSGVGTSIITGTITMEANKYFSALVFDSVSNPQGTFIIEDRTAPATGKVNVRFLNLVKGSSSVDIKRAGVTNSIFAGRTYNDHSTNTSLTSYTAIDPGPFTISAVVAGTSVTVSQINNFEATAGNSYTLVLRGFTNASGTQAVTLTAIKDN